jgi:translocation and assembly module TamB
VSRVRKILLPAGAVLTALLLLVAVCGVAVLRSDWFREQVRQRIVSEVEFSTGGQAQIGEFRFDWRRMQAEARSFVLRGREMPEEPPLFSAQSIQVGLKIVSILKRDVDIESLTIAEPRVRVVIYPDGQSNLPQPKVARSGKRPMEPLLALAIRRFRIENGVAEIDTRRIPLNVRGENLSARMFYEAAGPRYSGEVSFRQLRLSSPAFLPAPMDADLSLALEADRLVLQSARFASREGSAQVAGTIDNLLSPRVNVSFDAKLSLAELRSLLKSPLAVQGTLNLAGKLSYSGFSDYAVTGRASGSGLSVQIAGARAGNIRLASGLEARPGRIDLPQLAISAMGGVFSGQASVGNSKQLKLAGEVKGISIHELAQLRGMKAGPWNGSVSGPVEIEGELTGGRLDGLKASGRLSVEASADGRPVEGFVDLSFDQRTGALEFKDSRLSTPASRLQFSGALQSGLQVDLESRDLGDLLTAASYLGTVAPQTLPIALKGGAASFKGTVSGGLENPRFSGRVQVSKFLCQNQPFDRLEAAVIVSKFRIEASKVVLDQGGARLQGEGRAGLRAWKLDETGAVAGSFSLRGLALEKLLAETASKVPARGILSGAFQLAGTLGAPEISAKLVLAQGTAFGLKLDQARAQVHYASRSLFLDSLQLDSGTARLRATATFAHSREDWKSGSLRFEATGQSLQIAEQQGVAGLPEGLDGVADLQACGEATAKDAKLLLTGLWGQLALRNLTVDKKPAGNLQFTADTQAGVLMLKTTGEVAGTRVNGQTRCRLQEKYPVEGEASFAGLSLSALRPWLGSASSTDLPLDATAEGRISFGGAVLEPGSWTGRVEMSSVQIQPASSTKAQSIVLRNVGPVIATVSGKEAVIHTARFAGTDTNLEASGKIGLGTPQSAWDLRVRGGVSLAILHGFNPDLTASGDSTLDASIRGPLSRPEFSGRLEIKKASLYLSGVPNGIENASGAVLLFRDRATIEKMTAETGGGKLALNGFVGFGGGQPSYRLQATARQVRVRYPEGISTTVDASIDLTGTSSRSLVSGSIIVLRSSASPTVDLAGLLASSSKPMITPATQNELLRGMQFDVRVATSPNARFETMLTRDVQAEGDLRLRGTPYKPVLLGRISINQGEINFLGNRYTINRGDVSFLNPVRLEPVVNLDLETRVRGIDVALNFSGPLDNRLKLTYRSDPPLQANEIIALLAVGRAPSSDPALLARQSERDQSWQQIGASTLVGQALAAPLTSRLQRFFGVSRIKIDPKLTGLGNAPEAQLTLEQQVSKDITFTYVTSLAQEQQQLVRVEWSVNRRWSILAVREENGLFGIEFLYRKQFK